MISYMPFSLIKEMALEKLTRTWGALTVYFPAQTQIPEHMEPWVRQELLEIRLPQGVDENHLMAAIEDYKSWADLHQGNIADMAGFFKSERGRFPMMEDTNPTQIGHQIRHYGESGPNDGIDPVFKAALFLSMALEYDIQQNEMIKDMDDVKSMEQEMLQQLSEDGMHTQVTPGGSSALPGGDQAYQLYMMPQRVEAWARIALNQTPLSLLYITPGKAVFDHIADLFTEAVIPLGPAAFAYSGESRPSPSAVRQRIQEITHDPRCSSCGADPEAHEVSTGKNTHLRFCLLKDVPPSGFLTFLSGRSRKVGKLEQPVEGPRHTLIGLV